jgi:lysophospholipase L1-like esterase
MKGKSVKIVQLNGILKSELTADGIHLNETGYLLWRDIFKEEGIRF